MTGTAELPAWAAALTAFLLLLGAVVTLVGAVGLLRLRSFYERVHAPTLGTTLGTAAIALASMISFSALESRPVLHALLIVVFVTVTTPVSLMILVRAASLRDKAEGKLPACAEMCSTKALLGGDGDVIANIYRDRVTHRGKGGEVWGWATAYKVPAQGGQPGAAPGAAPAAPAAGGTK